MHFVRFYKISQVCVNIKTNILYNNNLLFLSLCKSYASKVRVRFAPSPTGFLHLGGYRTALYNYLYAKSHNGKFILRIEDTDISRTVTGAAQTIEDDLAWLYLTLDESPLKGGQFGPYTQSKRSHIYEHYIKLLLENGTSYKCFCSKERLQSLKTSNLPNDCKCRDLSSSEISELETQNTPFCIRLQSNNEIVYINDLIYGERDNFREVKSDPIIVRSDGLPTYHLAHVIDDHLMGITHVFRGVEWFQSLPMHLQLYKCFDWKPPLFGHLPILLNPDGSKLSKRNQDISIKELRRQGYSPEAVLNFTTLFGGGFSTIDHGKINNIEDLVEKFRVDHIATNQAHVDLMKLCECSRLYLRQRISDEEKLKIVINELKEIIAQTYNVIFSDDYYKQVVLWGQDRVYKLNDFTKSEFKYLWTYPDASIHNLKEFKFDSKLILHDLAESFRAIESSNFTHQKWSAAIKYVQSRHNLKAAPVMKLLRIALCNLEVGPSVKEVFSLLGKETIVNRLTQAHSSL